jgi:hypothetical protein
MDKWTLDKVVTHPHSSLSHSLFTDFPTTGDGKQLSFEQFLAGVVDKKPVI